LSAGKGDLARELSTGLEQAEAKDRIDASMMSVLRIDERLSSIMKRSKLVEREDHP
jgi:hypothetical protein